MPGFYVGPFKNRICNSGNYVSQLLFAEMIFFFFNLFR